MRKESLSKTWTQCEEMNTPTKKSKRDQRRDWQRADDKKLDNENGKAVPNASDQEHCTSMYNKIVEGHETAEHLMAASPSRGEVTSSHGQAKSAQP